MEEKLEVLEQENLTGEEQNDFAPTGENEDHETSGLSHSDENDDCGDDGWEDASPVEQGEKQADAPELFTLKNRDETRQVNRQELIAMAQKGWDYDRVRQERDQLRQYRQAMEQVRAPIRAVPKAEELSRRVRADAQRQDMERFLQAYPAVKADSIPREVWGQVAKGVPLISAYAMHENQQLRLQLNAQRQDRLNRIRTPGALGRSLGSEMDELDRMWNEEE